MYQYCCTNWRWVVWTRADHPDINPWHLRVTIVTSVCEQDIYYSQQQEITKQSLNLQKLFFINLAREKWQDAKNAAQQLR